MTQSKETKLPDDRFLDSALRPDRWDEYVGQEGVKSNLKILLQAAIERGHPPEHLLFYGPPGLGKTTLAYLVAKELEAQIKVTSGPAVEKVGDLASILTNLQAGDILFIDEIHRLNKAIEEVLYPAMESGSLNIIIGKGPSARTIQLELPPFTLIAATTRVALLSSPLRSRFSGGTFRMEFYTDEEVSRILARSADILQIKLNSGAARAIARRSRATPRIANQFLKRCRDYAQVKKVLLDERVVCEALEMLEVDELGLTAHDRRLLTTLIEKFNGGPVGLGTLAAATSEEVATVEEVYEPYLLQLGLIERTPRGREATPRAYEHLGFPLPKTEQRKLL
ncbi:MAG: Holliday junction branch migration DNA helicase RuvB [Candidatus Vogelbacteria bacterium CG10_big_fil_rev_8_21_14_0_10_51_16]|uniref:Holliday junction branch migration complex subunit RuvB n=1 Tax=Candidatus Vogelbacteria bacterium CG10_big_fil_rev_8_21_14_0_10_51_16 TaxID=1975045 RepID=A0A2H0RDW6_9BACT|nr:MAG: Holliday junction branch migration DNA helicase RuvB [Candidatus Vogelbacteria bacterium CG10_big_fil_rev_8_21_14_0_10_51_16]